MSFPELHLDLMGVSQIQGSIMLEFCSILCGVDASGPKPMSIGKLKGKLYAQGAKVVMGHKAVGSRCSKRLLRPFKQGITIV